MILSSFKSHWVSHNLCESKKLSWSQGLYDVIWDACEIFFPFDLGHFYVQEPF